MKIKITILISIFLCFCAFSKKNEGERFAVNEMETIKRCGNYAQISKKVFFCTNQNEIIELSEKMLELASNKVQKLQALLNIANAYKNMNNESPDDKFSEMNVKNAKKTFKLN